MGHFIKLKKNFQKNLINSAVSEVGSERKLSLRLRIPKSSLNFYRLGKRNLTEFRLKVICDFLKIPRNKIKQNTLGYIQENWGKVKGGKESVKSKIKKGTFKLNLEKLRKASSEYMKKWHKEMKIKYPEKYYKLQYKRFKKITGKPLLKTYAGIQVRNKYEKEVVNFLFKNNLNFKYEPYLNIKGKAYFPDILLSDKTIIEITAWKHPDFIKLKYIRQKIKDYKSAGYKVYFYIPLLYRNFYKSINKFVISDLNNLLFCLGSSDFLTKGATGRALGCYP